VTSCEDPAHPAAEASFLFLNSVIETLPEFDFLESKVKFLLLVVHLVGLSLDTFSTGLSDFLSA